MTEANALYHFGIKGQRWGVRRFQNADGTLTSDGRKRYRAYKKDWNAYNKLNRHVAASQKHLKEEGVMVDRVRDKYYKTNKDYEKEMRKSSGLFGSKAALKAERVANAQKNMDAAGSEYEKAAGAYGVAKKIANQDTKALRDHVDRMVKTYGKGSINELQTKTVKIGQNKLQKLMQGAPKSILFSNGRDTDEFVKTGLTLANMPVVGNLYTANYIAKRESELEKQRVEGSVRSAKRQLGGKNAAKYLDTEYFKDVSSLSDSKERNKAEREAKKAKKEAEKADKEAKKADKEAKKAEIKAQKADQKDRSGRYIDETYENIKDARKAAEAAKRAKQQDDKAEKAARKAEKALQKVRSSEYAEKTRNSIAEARKDSEARRSAYQQQEYERTMRKVENTKKTIKRNAKDARDYWQTSREMDKKTKQKLRSNPLKYYGTRAVVTTLGAAATAAAGPIAGYAARVAIKRHKKKKRQEAWDNFWGIKHSATYRVVRSDELYHHGIKGQRWGVRRYQNPDGTLTAKGKARYGKRLEKEGGVYLKKGSMVQRVSDVDETPGGNPNGTKHMYVAFTDEDKFRYKMASRSLGGTKFTVETPLGYQIDLKVKDDILAPGLKTQVDTAIDHVKNMSMDEVKSKFIDKKGYMKSTLYDDPEDFVSDLMKNNGSDKISDFQKRAYLHYSRNLMKDKDLRDQFFKSLSDKGYNAVIDYNDVAKWGISGDGKPTVVKGFSDKPLIVFDSSKSLEKVGSHAITYDEMANDAKNLKKMYSNRSALKKFGGAAAATAAAVPTAFVSPMAATVIAMYGGVFGITIPGMKDSIKSTNYSYYEKAYRKYANMQKNDPVAYKKSVKNIIEAVNKSKEAEKEAEKKDKAEG